ncbi:MAG: LiaI-LiaF-like domain-containing protein [Candidatus Krumholzibacteriia bacterium]
MNGEHNDRGQGTWEQPSAPRPAPPPPPAAIAARKSPALATGLSLMPGLGQIYVGYYQQGFIDLTVVATTITILSRGARGAEPLFGLFLAFFWLYNMIDANRRAHHYNRILDGLGGEQVPEDFQHPGARGSLPAGVILVIVGVLFLLDLNTDLSLDWIENWWPAFLIGGGVWLIVKARRKQG